jgi:hypothetical protein
MRWQVLNHSSRWLVAFNYSDTAALLHVYLQGYVSSFLHVALLHVYLQGYVSSFLHESSVTESSPKTRHFLGLKCKIQLGLVR